MKRLLKALLVLAGIAIVLGIAGTLAVRSIEQKMAALLEAEVPMIDWETIPDGTYEGSYDAFAVKVVVRVTFADGRIEDIVLVEHRNGQGSSGEAILETILDRQTLELDTIAGATYSSKAILLAVSDALLSSDETE